MADNTYQPGVYRQQGGTRFVVASSGELDVESGGEINVEAGGRLEVGGQPFITSGGSVDLTTDIPKGAITSTGLITGYGFTSTGQAGSIKGNTITSTGLITGNGFTSTGGTGDIKGIAVTSTGVITGDSFTCTGGSVGTIKGNTVTSTGTVTGNALATTGGLSIGAGFVSANETAASDSVDLLRYGLSIIKSTGTDEHVYTIDNGPVLTEQKVIVCNDVNKATGSSTGAAIVTTTGTWDGTNKNALFSTGGSNYQWLHAVGLATDRWLLLGYSTDVTFSNT